MKKQDKLEILLDRVLEIFHLNISFEKKKVLLQICRFFVVGGTATLLDWIIYYILCSYLHIYPLIANVISFSISVIYNYYASVKWVFNVDKKKSQKKLFIGFIVLSIIGLFIAELFLGIFINLLDINVMLSKVLSTIIVMIFNFITRKKYLE